MKQIVHAFLALMVFEYLLIAFTYWNINAAEWSIEVRFFYSFICVFANVGLAILIGDTLRK